MKFEFGHFEKSFLNADLLPGNKRPCYWLREPLVWFDTDGDPHSVPDGFVSDSYSYPDLVKSNVRGIKSHLPAFLHDFQIRLHECGFRLANRNLGLATAATKGSKYSAFKFSYVLNVAGLPRWWETGRDLKALGYDAVHTKYITDDRARALEIAMEDI